MIIVNYIVKYYLIDIGKQYPKQTILNDTKGKYNESYFNDFRRPGKCRP